MTVHEIVTGMEIGNWAVIGPGLPTHDGSGPWFECRCSCGKLRSVWGYTLANGKSTNCGCARNRQNGNRIKCISTRHGHCRTPKTQSKEWRAWNAMIRRCTYPSMDRYPRYGGRGITVCDKWRHSFQAFLADVGPAPTPSHTLGRIKNDGHYEPGNVEWQLKGTQARNKSSNRVITHNGESLTLIEWCERTGLKRQTIQMRLDVYGWSVERTLTTPAGG